MSAGTFPPRPRPKVPRLCIFCTRQAKLSAEHVWPQWFRDVVPRSDTQAPKTTHIVVREDILSGTLTVGKGRLTRPGELADQTLRVVCRPCNSGWMGRLQERARPTLEPMIRGHFNAVFPADQEALAAWATMAAMVLEFSDMETVAVTQGERDAFHLTKRALPNWRAWIGRNGGMSAAFYHSAMHFALRELAPGESNPYNTQATTIGIGKAVLHAFSSTAVIPDGLIAKVCDFLPRAAFQQIWPTSTEAVVAPDRFIDDAEFVVAARFLIQGIVKGRYG